MTQSPTILTGPGEKTGGPLRALILDDDAFDRRRLAKMMDRLPLAVQSDSAASLEELKARMADGEYDVVFIDYSLTDGNGIDALRLLRTDRGGNEPACVMVTGAQGADVATACFRDGCQDFISKADLSPETLAVTIDRIHHAEGEVLPPLNRTSALPATKEIVRELANALKPAIQDAIREALAEQGRGNVETSELIANMLRTPDDFVFRLGD